ncbi:Cupredoxin [Xylariales sp. AK1849]|nr:Cupredoxin [Xylariales sp. AK1849]
MSYLRRLIALVAYLVVLQPSVATREGATHDEAWEPEHVLIATAQIAINCESQYSVAFNGTSSGPALCFEEGKTTWVRVYSQIEDKNVTTPIAPGEYLDYEIRPEVGDADTYFYHSHVEFQSVTAHGLLLVEGANGTTPYEYDDDIPVVLSDCYRNEDEVLEAGLVANPFEWSGEPLALVMNNRSDNASFSNTTDDSCKTYRLRFVKTMALSFVLLGIEVHADLTIIEADGQYTKPTKTDHIQLVSGQRYSALLKTKSQEELDAEGESTYRIRYENRDRPTNVTGYAVSQYSKESCKTRAKRDLPVDLPVVPPVTLSRSVSEYTNWLEHTLEPLNQAGSFPVASEVTRTVCIQVGQHVVNEFYNGSVQGILQWDANKLTWAEAALEKQHFYPYLVSAYKLGQRARSQRSDSDWRLRVTEDNVGTHAHG